MTVVVDASVVVAALIDNGPIGSWAAQVVRPAAVMAPQMMPAECANVLRNAVRRGDISADTGALAHHDLLEVEVKLFDYRPVASRVWELRENLTTYDAWYVALAESLDAPLATLDLRLARAAGPRCEFATPSR